MTNTADIDERVKKFDMAALILPPAPRDIVRGLDRAGRAAVEEIRVRVGQPLSVVTPRGEISLGGDMMTRRDLDGILDIATGASAHTARESVRGGYLTVRGGFRIGLCGSAITRDGEITGFRSLSSAAIRIPREVRGLSNEILPRLITRCLVPSTLILSPPGGGKTTLLRDLIRAVSDGDAAYGLRPERVSLADERSEIAAVYDGVPQLDVGAHTDVLDACPKAQAVIMLLRAMNPNVVALDEVTAERDVAAIISAANCGARIFATAHAAGEGDLRRRPVYRLLRECGVFEKTVTITRECGVRRYRVSDAQSEATA